MTDLLAGTRELITTGEAATILGLDPSRVRLLTRKGDLTGVRLGGQWLIERSAVTAYLERVHDVGRPFSQRIAWSVLAALEGTTPPWELHREEQARIRDYVTRTPAALSQRLNGRARSERLSVGPNLFDRLESHPGWRRGGVGGRESAPTVIYARDGERESLVEHANAVVDREQPNLLLRLIEDRWWPFGDAERGTTVWSVVADLDRLEFAPSTTRRSSTKWA